MIVSRDTGFDPLLRYLKARGLHCRREVPVTHAPSVAAVTSSGLAATGAAADLPAVPDRSLVASDRPRRHPLGATQSRALLASRALSARRADSLPGRRIGSLRTARQAHAAVGRLRALGLQTAVLSPSTRRSRLEGDGHVMRAGDSTGAARGTANTPGRSTARPAAAPARSVLLSTSGMSHPARKAAGASCPSKGSHKARGAVRQSRASVLGAHRQD